MQLQEGSAWVIRRLRQLFPRQSPFSAELDDNEPNCALCIQHIMALKDAISTKTKPRFLQDSEILGSVYLDGGIYLWAKGLLYDGRALTGEAKELCDAQKVGRLMAVQVYSFHASVLSDSGELRQALEYFEKSLNFLKDHLLSVRDTAADSELALLANAYNNLAAVNCTLGNYGKAEMYNELALQQKHKLAGKGLPMSHLLCLSYQNIASTYAAQRRYEQAAEFFEKGITVASQEESSSRRALTSHNFGIMRLIQGRVEDARQLFESAWQLRAEKVGEHPDTAASLHMLACCYHKLQDGQSLELARLVTPPWE